MVPPPLPIGIQVSTRALCRRQNGEVSHSRLHDTVAGGQSDARVERLPTSSQAGPNTEPRALPAVATAIGESSQDMSRALSGRPAALAPSLTFSPAHSPVAEPGLPEATEASPIPAGPVDRSATMPSRFPAEMQDSTSALCRHWSAVSLCSEPQLPAGSGLSDARVEWSPISPQARPSAEHPVLPASNVNTSGPRSTAACGLAQTPLRAISTPGSISAGAPAASEVGACGQETCSRGLFIQGTSPGSIAATIAYTSWDTSGAARRFYPRFGYWAFAASAAGINESESLVRRRRAIQGA